MQLAVANINAHDLRSAVLQQAISESASRLTYIEAAQTRNVKPRGLQRTFEL